MTTSKTILTSAIVSALVVAALWLAIPAKTPVAGLQSFGNTSIDGSQANLPTPSNFDYLVARVALGLGTNMTNSNTGAGNVNIFAQRMALTVATTTPCAIQNPTTATTSALLQLNITTGTSTAGTLTVATSTTAFATTTAITTLTVGANNPEAFSIDGGGATSNMLVAPLGWVVVGAAGAPGGFTYGGTCAVVFTTF